MAESEPRDKLLEILRYAIREEQKAKQRYSEWAELEVEPELRALFRSLAEEEARHEAMLQAKQEQAEKASS
jgi:rubrerythrin